MKKYLAFILKGSHTLAIQVSARSRKDAEMACRKLYKEFVVC